jgi:hypothetical protein
LASRDLVRGFEDVNQQQREKIGMDSPVVDLQCSQYVDCVHIPIARRGRGSGLETLGRRKRGIDHIHIHIRIRGVHG